MIHINRSARANESNKDGIRRLWRRAGWEPAFLQTSLAAMIYDEVALSERNVELEVLIPR
ncbi:MAG: hypothetical protein CSB44_10390 [Gammaproteobacteria bacterium]|nr:MAG: hypothetical protein CSB44_10390 [Gammaproteobacteria bacterium]PIE35527.1 MAG: hypothetical protein CSA54_05425 [Gammaproteobacteria bacterium]